MQPATSASNFAKHIFREHNPFADLWAAHGRMAVPTKQNTKWGAEMKTRHMGRQVSGLASS